MKQESSQKIVRRLFGFSIGPIISAAIGFVWVPVVTRIVSPEEFGKAAMYTTAVSLITMILYLGLDRAFIREYHLENDKNNLMLNAILFPMLLAVIIGMTSQIYHERISIILFGSKETFIIKILCLHLIVNILNRFYEISIRMSEKAFQFSSLIVFKRISTFIISLASILIWQRSFRGLILGNCIGLTIYSIIVSIAYKPIKIKNLKVKIKKTTQMLKYGMPLLLSGVLVWFLNSMDKIALRKWADFTQIGLYSGAFKIVSIIIIIQQAFTTFWTPTAYRWFETNENKEMFEKVQENIFVFMFLVFSTFIVFRKIFVLILSKEFYEVYRIIPFLILIPVVNICKETTCLGINFSRKTNYHVIIFGSCAVLNLIGNSILVPKYGVMGASVSTGLSYFIMFWLETFVSRKLWFKYNLKTIFITTCAMIVLSFSTLYVKMNIYIEIIFIVVIIIINIKTIKKMFLFVKNNYKEIISPKKLAK